MNNKAKTLGIILARGGSKSIPKKSIALCAGKPLMGYTIDAIKNAKLIDRTIIVTDSKEMADYARGEGIDVPFVEPDELAGDSSPDLPIMKYTLEWLEENENYKPDMVIHLRATTPLKSSVDIDRGIEIMALNPEAQSLRSICESTHTPFKMYRLDSDSKYLKPIMRNEFPEVFEKYSEPYNMPRQLLPVIWRHSGYIDIIRPDVITEKNSMSGSKILPLRFDKWRDVDIDSFDDLLRAELIIKRLREKGMEPWEEILDY